MAAKKFGIKTFKSFNRSIVEFEKEVLDDKNNPIKISPTDKSNPYSRGPKSFTVNIHELDVDGELVPIRNYTNECKIILTPRWINKETFYSEVTKLLDDNENAHEVLGVVISLICPSLNYVIDSKVLPLSDIDNEKPLFLNSFLLDDVKSKIIVQSKLIRIKSSNPKSSLIASSNLTILAKDREITFYIDPTESIGNNALSISPGDTGECMFLLKNVFPLVSDPPELIYDRKFLAFFNAGDEYDTVQCILLLIGQPYCDSLLRWIIFGKPSFNNPDHIPIIRFIADILEVGENDLENINYDGDEAAKLDSYLRMQNMLFENIQTVDRGWSKILYTIIKDEKNG